jgi:hypothetical protein
LLEAVRFLAGCTKTIVVSPEAMERVTRRNGWNYECDLSSVLHGNAPIARCFYHRDTAGDCDGYVQVPLRPEFKDYARCVYDWAENIAGVGRTYTAAEILAAALAVSIPLPIGARVSAIRGTDGVLCIGTVVRVYDDKLCKELHDEDQVAVRFDAYGGEVDVVCVRDLTVVSESP